MNTDTEMLKFKRRQDKMNKESPEMYIEELKKQGDIDRLNQEIDIEELKKRGAINQLKQEIDSLQFELTNKNWEHIKDGYRYTKLGRAIGKAEVIIYKMKTLLKALQELEASNL